MKEIVEKTLQFYFEKLREPKLSELDISLDDTISSQGCGFVTLYHKWEVCGSAGNIKEIKANLWEELIASTFAALTDKRFSALKKDEFESLQFRIDHITKREIIHITELKNLDPVKQGCIAISRDYEKLGVILPNMSAKLLSWSDFIPALEYKLEKKDIDDTHYIFYRIETRTETNY